MSKQSSIVDVIILDVKPKVPIVKNVSYVYVYTLLRCQCRCTALAYFEELMGEVKADNADGFVKGNQERAEHGRFGRKIGGGMTAAERSGDAARALFPAEKWTRVCRGVFLAEGRKAQGEKSNAERQKLKKEIGQARILAKRGHCVYLVPETGVGKHYDAIVDGRKTEFKTITGNMGTLGKQYKGALKQGDDVFIRTSGKTRKDIYFKLIGETNTLLKSGCTLNASALIYVWIDGENRLTKWSMASIMSSVSRS